MTDAQALFERGHAALESGDFNEAVESLSRTIAADPRVAAGYRLRSKAYLALGDRPKAIADLDSAIRFRPNDVQAIAERAAELLKQRRYTDSIADCDTALRLDPGRVDLFAVRGRSYAMLGESAAAFADFDAAIHADADRAAEHLTQRAKLHLECGDPRAAIDDADTALRLDEEYLLAFEVRALAHRDLGELHSAADDFSRAARDPNVIAPRIGLLLVLHQLQEWVALAEAADELLARAPELPQALELRGRAALTLGEPARALAVFTQLIEKLPSRAAGYALRASAYEAAGSAPSAVRDYLHALKCEPNDAGTLNQLAWLLATNDAVKNAMQAKELATRACELSSWEEAGYLDTLAVACAELGEVAEAMKWMEKAIELDDREEYRERLTKWRQSISDIPRHDPHRPSS